MKFIPSRKGWMKILKRWYDKVRIIEGGYKNESEDGKV